MKRFPAESDEYRAARERLLQREIGLRREMEAVAAELAVVAKAPLERILTFAGERGWRRLLLLSSAANGYNRDYHAETEDGAQRPILNVFHRDGGTIRHFWASELMFAPANSGQDWRHVGTLEPVWNIFDLTPAGRPDWDEQLDYD